jgi:hypothetical protein
MTIAMALFTRRHWLHACSLSTVGIMGGMGSSVCNGTNNRQAQVAITFDLEMARNFPEWEDTHWDYQKGNLDSASKQYSLKVADIVRDYGGRIHFFCVGSALEQENVQWLKRLAKDGHPIGNHTYDHVNLLATRPMDTQFRFQRSPWLVSGQSTMEVLERNIALTRQALKERIDVDDRGFRTPGGFSHGLVGREDLQRMLLDFGFTWVSSLYPSHANTAPQIQPDDSVYESIVSAQAQSQPFRYPTGLIEIPMSPISDIGAFRNGRWELDWFLEAIGRALSWTIDHGAVFDFLAHPSCLGVVDPECRAVRLICEMVKSSADRARLVDLDQIAATLTEGNADGPQTD